MVPPLLQTTVNLLHQYFDVTVVALALSLPIFYCIIRRLRNSKQMKSPPEVKNGWPIIGHLHLFRGSKKPLHLAFKDLADTYGPIFTLRLGIQRIVVISSREAAKECFTKTDLAIASRPKMIASEHLGYDYAMFGIAPYGPVWRELRKISMTELLSNHKLEPLKHFRVSEVQASIHDLYTLWMKSSGGSGNAVVAMDQWFFDLALNIIVRMVNRKKYCTMDPVNEEARRVQKGLLELFHMFGTFVLADYLPFLRWLDLGGHEKAMKICIQGLDGVLQGWIDECRQRVKSADTDASMTDERDFIDMLYALLDGGNLGGYDVDTVVKATVLDIIGGSDTITVTLKWALSLLLNNRAALRKAQDELELHVGKHRQVSESNIPNLVYLQAVVKETLRLYPAAPLAAPHLATQDCSIGGYSVPAGTRVFVNLYKIQRDPDTWADPSEFCPDRFLTTHKEADVRGSQGFELLPFGAGRRKCPGASLGVHVVHLTLASLVHAFELSTPEDAPIDMTQSSGLTNTKATPLSVVFAPRLAHHLY